MNGKKVNIINTLFLCLVFLSTIINVLFYNNIVPNWSMHLAFILVLLCSIVVNILSMKNSDLNKDNAESTSRSKKVILIIVGVIWFITYVMVLLVK